MSSELEKFAAASPLAKWLGFSFEHTGDGFCYSLAFDEKHIGNPAIRALHGGVVETFLEFASQCELAAALDNGAPIKTVNVDIDYLASSRPQAMSGRVKIARLGRRIAFVEATGWQESEDRPVAKARFRMRIGDQGA